MDTASRAEEGSGLLALLALERGLDPFFSAVGVLDRSEDISNSSECYTNS